MAKCWPFHIVFLNTRCSVILTQAERLHSGMNQNADSGTTRPGFQYCLGHLQLSDLGQVIEHLRGLKDASFVTGIAKHNHLVGLYEN